MQMALNMHNAKLYLTSSRLALSLRAGQNSSSTIDKATTRYRMKPESVGQIALKTEKTR
jgi:hypothetical protein